MKFCIIIDLLYFIFKRDDVTKRFRITLIGCYHTSTTDLKKYVVLHSYVPKLPIRCAVLGT